MKITYRDGFVSTWKQGTLPDFLTREAITARLGVEPREYNDDETDGKVTLEWSFNVDGRPCGIWDYYGRRWSTFGPDSILARLFNSYEPLGARRNDAA